MIRVKNEFTCSNCGRENVDGLNIDGSVHAILHNGPGSDVVCKRCIENIQPEPARGRK